MSRRRTHDERGTSTVEVVILAPALGLLVLLAIAGGRLAIASQAVQSSAAEAARSASIARTHSAAQAAASSAARARLASQRVNCASVTVTVDTAEFATPVGIPASVGATVTCRVDLSGLLPGLPATVPVTASIRSPLDTYRER